MTSIPIDHPCVRPAATWLRDNIPLESLALTGMTGSFEEYFRCSVGNSLVTFDNDADATAFLLRWA